MADVTFDVVEAASSIEPVPITPSTRRCGVAWWRRVVVSNAAGRWPESRSSARHGPERRGGYSMCSAASRRATPKHYVRRARVQFEEELHQGNQDRGGQVR